MENYIYLNRTGLDLYVNLNKGFYYYLRYIYAYYGNTPDARHILKQIKQIIEREKRTTINSFGHSISYLYEKCGNKTYNDLMEASISMYNRYSNIEKELLHSHLRRYKNIIKRLTQ